MPPKLPPEKKPATAAGAKKASAAATGSQRDRAAAGPQIKLVTKLEENDVLMGRGALATDYEGNLRLRELVQTRQAHYAAATKRSQKHRIAEEIVQTVKERGGRFLQGAETLKDVRVTLPRYEAAWFVVEDEAVLIAKVKQLIRDTKPRNSAVPPRINQESQQQNVLLTHQAPVGPTGDHMQPPGSNFLWQQHVQSQQANRHAARQTQQQGVPNQVTASESQTASGSTQPSDDTSVKTEGSSSVNDSQTSSTIEQHQASISTSTAHLGQDNAASILQSLTAANTPEDQQLDALLALSLASRLEPRNSAAPVAGHQATGPSRGERTRSLELIAATLIAQNQRREREHNLVNAILAKLLPQIMQEGGQAAPPPAPSTEPDPAMTWLYNQLQARSNETRAPAQAPAPTSLPAPAAPSPSNFPANLAGFLRGEQTAPRQTGMLEQPSRLVELERLLLNQDQWSRTTASQSTSSSSTTRRSRDPEDGLAQLLRSLQRQYFPPQPPS